MSRRWVRSLLAIVLTGCVIAAVLYYVDVETMAEVTSRISWQGLALLFGLSLASQGLLCEQFHRLLQMYSVSLTPRWETYALATANTLLNLLPLRGGTLAKGAYLVATRKVRFGQAVELTLVGQSMMLIVAAIAGLAVWPWTQSQLSAVLVGVNGVFALALTGVVGAIALPWLANRLKMSLPRVLDRMSLRVSDALRHLRAHPWHLAWVVGLLAALFAFWTIRLSVAFTLVGAPLSAPSLIAVQAVVALSGIVSISPGNLGAREGLIVLMAIQFGIGGDLALLASVVDRLVSLLVIFLVGPVAVWVLAKYGRKLERAEA